MSTDGGRFPSLDVLANSHVDLPPFLSALVGLSRIGIGTDRQPQPQWYPFVFCAVVESHLNGAFKNWHIKSNRARGGRPQAEYAVLNCLLQRSLNSIPSSISVYMRCLARSQQPLTDGAAPHPEATGGRSDESSWGRRLLVTSLASRGRRIEFETVLLVDPW